MYIFGLSFQDFEPKLCKINFLFRCSFCRASRWQCSTSERWTFLNDGLNYDAWEQLSLLYDSPYSQSREYSNENYAGPQNRSIKGKRRHKGEKMREVG